MQRSLTVRQTIPTQAAASANSRTRPLVLDCAVRGVEELAKALVAVRRDTVVHWQRERFRRYCTHLSKRSGKPGPPAVSFEIRELIRTMALANGLWHAPRIHGELQKLRIEVSERTVSRILRTVMRPPSPIWKTFLHNHIGEVVAVDFFTVPTIRLRVLCSW